MRALFDKDGIPTGLYESGYTLEGAVELTDEQYQLLLSTPVGGLKYLGGKLVEVVVKPSVEEVYGSKVREVVTGSDAALAMVKLPFSQVEVTAWSQQETGARIILGDLTTKNYDVAVALANPAACAIAKAKVEELAAIDNVSAKEFSLRILGHAEQALAVAGFIWAQQRTFEKLLWDLYVSGDAASLLSVKIEFQLPG